MQGVLVHYFLALALYYGIEAELGKVLARNIQGDVVWYVLSRTFIEISDSLIRVMGIRDNPTRS
jgi:hypothetical protein